MLAPSLPVLAAGLVVFGVGMGLTYYAALYYSLAVGHAAVDAGGTFEALIGFGYFAGPLLGLGARAVVSPDHAASATVMLAWLVVGGCSAGALGATWPRAARGDQAYGRVPRAARDVPLPDDDRCALCTRLAAERGAQQRRDLADAQVGSEPIVSGASVRSRKRARSPSSTSANRIAGSVTPAARSWRRIRMPCVSARRRRGSASRSAGAGPRSSTSRSGGVRRKSRSSSSPSAPAARGARGSAKSRAGTNAKSSPRKRVKRSRYSVPSSQTTKRGRGAS